MYHPHTRTSIQQAHRPTRCLISQVSFRISATHPSAHLRTDSEEDNASLLYISVYHPRTRNSIQGTHRPTGCLISPVSFRQSTINHNAVLWKLTCREKSGNTQTHRMPNLASLFPPINHSSQCSFVETNLQREVREHTDPQDA